MIDINNQPITYINLPLNIIRSTQNNHPKIPQFHTQPKKTQFFKTTT